MKLVVGLGNPGKQYQLTRHNIGFIVLDAISQKLANTKKQKKFNSLYCKINYQGHDVILLEPQTFMNLSGHSVINFVNYFKIKLEDILIIHDEVDLPFSQVQFKQNGSSAGHNGLKSIFQSLKTEQIMRLRIGIGRSMIMKTADWVLANFTYQELLAIENGKNFLSDCVLNWITSQNKQNLLTKYNNQKF